ncbi:hypothetical protein KOI40_03060 [Aestuariicella sp. G3-2]|uniref:hypothetical protein n=1 Tax=Pseudomaricurvus albidus TaxID=2842452 RepID=UPI001C0C2BF5|nr:hypothetical protein [Aestuariicella albida]MBU3068781.1 hypothetical protein [Aestuariicella albida]
MIYFKKYILVLLFSSFSLLVHATGTWTYHYSYGDKASCNNAMSYAGSTWNMNGWPWKCDGANDGNGYYMSNGLPCEDPEIWNQQTFVCESPPAPEPYFCEDGTVSYTGISGCDVPPEQTPECGNNGEGLMCYNGAWACYSYQCPEFVPDDPQLPDDPEDTEPNGVCESGEYSQFSMDPDCAAPPPNPCPGDCDNGDSTPDPAGEDHDGDGVPNENDPDADSDGDNIPNGVDPHPNGGDGNGTPPAPGEGYSPDSDGDGQTDDQEEGQEDGSVSGGASCKNPVQCEGSAFECATIIQLWKLRCEGEFEEPEGFDGNYKIDLANLLLDKQDEFNQVFSDLQNQAMSQLDFNLNSGGGIDPNIQQIKGVDVDFSWSRFTSELSIVGTVIIALASLVGLRIILED